MDELKAKWKNLDTPVKAVAVAVAVIVGLVFVLKILPALFVGMGIAAFLLVLFVPYWAPTIIAFVRHHPSKGGILAVNMFFGWTFVGWVVALAWALSDNSGRASSQSVVINNVVSSSAMPAYGAAASVPPAVPAPQQYQVGDVVNGHRFNGQAWLPVPASQSVMAPPVPLEPTLNR
jgi:hypothetical protein